MMHEERLHLLAEQTFLARDLVDTPVGARLTRMSIEARLRKIGQALAKADTEDRPPARARLTFDGAPVVGSHGILADFGMKAVNSFTDAVTMIAASLAAPLAAMGPIPNRDQHRLLITGTALGSFGFELEEYRAEPPLSDEAGALATALERAGALLQSTLGNDDDLAEIASETDPRALEKVRAFLKVLVDNSAVCALQNGEQVVRFADAGQVRRSLDRLDANNLHEQSLTLHGQFVGVLPKSRMFEFQPEGEAQIIRGKIAPHLQNVEALNAQLNQAVRVDMMRIQAGHGRPRYVLATMPQWQHD